MDGMLHRWRMFGMAALVCVAACEGDDGDDAGTGGTAGTADTADTADTAEPTGGPATGGCLSDGTGRLHLELSGAVTRTIDWSDAELECGSIPSIDGMGFSTSFANPGLPEPERITVLLVLEGVLPGETGSYTAEGVTINVAPGTNQVPYFTYPDETCTADIDDNRLLLEGGNGHGIYAVSGSIACPLPLRNFEGDASVTLVALEFTGLASF
jgi:hypothetical protein